MNSKVRNVSDSLIKDRQNGLSIMELSLKYNLSKSTVSLICKKVVMSKTIINKRKRRWYELNILSRKKAIEKNKSNRVERVKREKYIGSNIVGELSNRDLLVVGISLYWAEGSKKETGAGFNFINSDPNMILFMNNWLKNVINIKKQDICFNLVINSSHKSREDQILKFWSNLLDLEIQDFGNTVFINTKYKREYKNHQDYTGMIRIKVKKSSWLRRRIVGMIDSFGSRVIKPM